jgi:hypothetical protein
VLLSVVCCHSLKRELLAFLKLIFFVLPCFSVSRMSDSVAPARPVPTTLSESFPLEATLYSLESSLLTLRD